jgi:hypothetical protein
VCRALNVHSSTITLLYIPNKYSGQKNPKKLPNLYKLRCILSPKMSKTKHKLIKVYISVLFAATKKVYF